MISEILATIRGIPWVVVPTTIAGVVCICVRFVGTALYNGFMHPLRAFPGPFLWGVSGIPFAYYNLRGTSMRRVTQLHEKYGPVVRIGPAELSYATADVINQIYGARVSKDGNPLMRASAGLSKPSDITAADVDDHARQRKQLLPAFSEKALREQEPLIMEHIDSMIAQLKRHSNEAVDMSAWFNWTTFDIIGDLTFGDDVFQCIKLARYHPLVSNVMVFFKSIAVLRVLKQNAPWALPIFVLGFGSKVFRELADSRRLVKEYVDKRLSTDTDHPDFIKFILSTPKEGPSMLTTGEIYPTSYSILAAGSETTATLLTATIYFLSKHPDKLSRLRDEIRHGFAQESDINSVTVAEKKYLLAVLNEAMRLFPPVPARRIREVREGGLTIGGRYVPPGTLVGSLALACCHLSSNFTDPLQFVPERWIDGENQRYENDKREALDAFSVGPLSCIGINLAYMEMRLILARFIWNFDIELVQPDIDWTNQTIFIVWDRPELMVKVTPRE